MATAYLPIQTTKIKGCIKLLLVLIVTLIAFSISLNTAAAQVHNLSDWNVPPPLPPGTITRGNTTGKPATAKATVLPPGDVPIPAQPSAPPVKMPYLATVITTSPFAASPGGPDKLSIDPKVPDIPLPEAPDAPSLPQQTWQDKPAAEVIDLPVPESPEMPPLPQEPASSGQTSPSKLLIPLMPEVLSLKSPSLPPANAPMYWPTPAIPGDISIKLSASAAEKAVKSRRKGNHKLKTKPLRI